MRTVLIYGLFLFFVVGAGLLSGLSNLPGEWYQALEKPSFNPPNWIFGPVWTLLYMLIAVAGARIWQTAPKSAAMQLWFAQMALNMLWSPAFFGLENPGLALLVIAALLASILAFMQKAAPIDRPAALICIPYLAWVGFATLLNASIFLLN